jgi:alkylation response protein AidB-like acyl-CoA dehydrogenase
VTTDLKRLREEVRTFTRDRLAEPEYRGFLDYLNFSAGHSPSFSRLVASEGWVGMTIPTEYGGHGRSSMERFVVTEEFLRLGAPVAAHWIADRQTAPMILTFGTEEQKLRFLPGIAGGECFFSVGMSEPEAGSDLAAIRTSAVQVDGGWVVNGEKLWTSFAHVNHYVLLLCRTSTRGEDRHEGLTQLIVPLQSPGIEIRPIALLDDTEHFNQVHFQDVFVPDDLVLGTIGQGWAQVNSELASERTGPDRYLSSYRLLESYLNERGDAEPGEAERDALGESVAKVWAIRQIAQWAVTGNESTGAAPGLMAALSKDLGTTYEQRLIELLGGLLESERRVGDPSQFVNLLAQGTLIGPSFTLRGGTTEVLRIVAARGLGVGR